MDKATYETTKYIKGPMHQSLRHDSAHKHVAGSAEYIDDIPEPAGLLHGALGMADRAHAEILSIDLSAVKAYPGVVCVLTADDITGVNDVSSGGRHDEPLIATDRIEFHGQTIFAVIAETRDAARKAARLAKVDYRDLPFWTDIDGALENGSPLVTPGMTLKRGTPETELDKATHSIQSSMRIGGQEHFYLESHIALAIPGEDDDVTVWSSTQHPSEIQHIVGHVLDIPSNAVTVNTRRMGGGFGGKETQGNQFAALAALAAKKLKRAVKFRPDRDEDMGVTGKRHDFKMDFDVAFDGDGKIHAIEANFAARCGYSSDLSGPVTDRALFHADSSYFYPHVKLTSQPLKTHTVSNTAYRGFGGPQGMLAIENLIDEIARRLGKDPLEVRKLNYYGTETRNVTPYHQAIEDNIIHEMTEEIETSSAYVARRREVDSWNRVEPVLKKGLAFAPLKFGISFTTTFLNQAGALVHVYSDGSVQLNHGGTEMGQGLYIKIAQIVAEEFQIDVERVKITATTTAKVPNTSATAASSGTDLNGMAAQAAAREIKNRLIAFAARHFQVPTASVRLVANRVEAGENSLSFAELIGLAYKARVSLSSTGFYRTPLVHYDRNTASGRPFFYFAYGVAVAEVLVDTLTGEYKVTRADLLHDVGRSINPAIDMGQIEGGFIQGMGWLTSEELWWDKAGALKTHAPSTYKIPVARDLPADFRVRIWERSENPAESIHRSKAVGEPPLMLANAVFFALKDAVHAAAGAVPQLDAPATPERVLLAIEDARAQAKPLAESAE